MALDTPDKKRVRKALRQVRHDPATVTSGLKGPLSGFRKIEIGSSLRVVLKVEGTYITVYAVGQHENFYDKVIRRMRRDGLI